MRSGVPERTGRVPPAGARTLSRSPLAASTSPRARSDLLARIVRNANGQETPIAGLLDLSRIRTGRMALAPEAFDLCDFEVRLRAETAQP